MSLLVKICGLSTRETLDVALAAGADMVGFVFFPPSPRHVGFEAARDLARQVRGRARKVALSVDAPDEWLASSIEALQPDMLQLHGKETPERVVTVRSRFGIPVIKAVAIEDRADLAAIQAYAVVADFVLFDARAPREATRPGGLGKSFDWRLLENLNIGVPFMLSGGLNPDNVVAAARERMKRPQPNSIGGRFGRPTSKKVSGAAMPDRRSWEITSAAMVSESSNCWSK
jgi:phosphoribosylanthranilate isomerase